MAKIYKHSVVRRYEGNPLLTLENIPFPCNTVFNAAAVKFEGEYLLMLRVEDLVGRSVLVMARGKDGCEFEVDKLPIMEPSGEEPYATYEKRGIEDPRITEIDGVFYIMYTAASEFGARLALAKTTDFKSIERMGLVSQPENKDGVLFPKKIKGRYARLDRPMGGGVGNIWISYSHDLLYWGDSEIVMTVRSDHWDSWRIGASAQPIEIGDGWLEIYHGVKMTSGGPIYRLGAVVLDHANPARVICRTAIPILSPHEYYERVGDVGNVVFSCGAVLEPNGQDLKIYYGAGDTAICVAEAKVNELMQFCTIGEH